MSKAAANPLSWDANLHMSGKMSHSSPLAPQSCIEAVLIEHSTGKSEDLTLCFCFLSFLSFFLCFFCSLLISFKSTLTNCRPRSISSYRTWLERVRCLTKTIRQLSKLPYSIELCDIFWREGKQEHHTPMCSLLEPIRVGKFSRLPDRLNFAGYKLRLRTSNVGSQSC